VRVETPSAAGEARGVSTGFIVQGLSGRYFVATSTHALLLEASADQEGLRLA
jgi:hypothetical protein